MDIMSFLAATPYAWCVPYVAAAAACAMAITAAFPAPTTQPLLSIWALLNLLAMNVGHAKNAAPASSSAPALPTPPASPPPAAVVAALLGLGLCLSACTSVELAADDQQVLGAAETACQAQPTASIIANSVADAVAAADPDLAGVAPVTQAISGVDTAICDAVAASPTTLP